MESQVTGLIKKYPHRPNIGYTDKNTVKLDFDNTNFKTVKYWAFRSYGWFRLEGFLIFKSSEDNYHVIFDSTVSWIENMHIVAWVCLGSQNIGLQKWFLMQCIKKSSTLRVSPKGEKPSPRIVFRFGKEDNEIKNFLQYRRRIKKIFSEY